MSAGRSGQRWGLLLVAASIIGVLIVGPSTGWFTIAAALAIVAGIMALFTRRTKRPGSHTS